MIIRNRGLGNWLLLFAAVVWVHAPTSSNANDSVDPGQLVEEFWINELNHKRDSVEKVKRLYKVFHGRLQIAPPRWWIHNVRSLVDGEKPDKKPRSRFESKVVSVGSTGHGNVIRIRVPDRNNDTEIEGIKGDREELEACKVFVFDHFARSCPKCAQR